MKIKSGFRRRIPVDQIQLSFNQMPVFDHAHECCPLAYNRYPVVVQDAFSLVYLVEGKWRFTLNGEDFLFGPDSCFIQYPGLSIAGSFCDAGRHAYYSIAVKPALSHSGPQPVYQVRMPRMAEHITSPVLQQLLKKVIHYEAVGSHLSAAGCFFKALSVYASSQGPAKKDYGRLYRDQIIHYLETHFTSAVSVGEVAAHVGLSVPYCCNIFKRQAGVSILHYLNGLRIRRAKELIQAGGYPLKRVAEMAGLENYAYFCRIFRQYEGMSPSQFRQLHTGAEVGFICAKYKTPAHITYLDGSEWDAPQPSTIKI